MEDGIMVTSGLAPDCAAPRSRVASESVPYCFILDDAYHVVMAGPSTGADPLAELYEADSQIDMLPGRIDRVVRMLTAAWRSSQPATAASACIQNFRVTVAPLHGYDGRRIAVFVDRLESGSV